MKMDGELSTNQDTNNNLSDLDTKEEDEVSKCTHSKFCFSRDLSEREQTLLRPPCSENVASCCLTNANRKPFKKIVTFDRSAPKLITLNGLDNDDSDSDMHMTRNKPFGLYFDISSDSESTSPSESEIFNTTPSDDISNQSEIIAVAEKKLTKVLNRLQGLWLNIQDNDSELPANFSNLGNKNLLQTVSLVEVVTDQLSIQYRSNDTRDPNHLNNLTSTHDVLEEELKNSKNKVTCLEAEIKYYSRENALLNREVKEMAYKMASNGFKGTTEKFGIDTKSPETEIFYKNPHQLRFDSSDSKSSGVVDNNRAFSCADTNKVSASGKNDSPDEMMVLKRETEMDSLIRDFHEKFSTNNCSLHAQFQIYDEHLENWKRMLHASNDEKHEMFQDLTKVVAEHKAALKERDHYEFILKLLIQEKGNDDFDMQNLLQNIIVKLQEPCDDSGSCVIQTSLLEGAVLSLQQNNSIQRDEIYRLKHLLSESHMRTQVQANELDDCNKKIAQYLDELNSNEAKLKIIQEEANGKCEKIQELCNDAVAVKTVLDKKLSEKETEVKELQDLLNGMKKANKRHSKQFQDLQKNNLVLIKEMKESKGKMDHLTEMISQLRSVLKDQKLQWNERLRISNEEASQNKQHCEWLKCQLEQVSQQLKDAHDRLRLHEMDKVQLAQQLLLAEEERRVVDRKLQELRTALQGDTGLREALIERNETLQIEINRLRHTKISPQKMGIENSPPMEMLQTDEILLSAALLPPTEIHHTDKFSIKKNCYTANHRRPNDIPRTAVSLHNGGVK